ncbi:MAG: family 78 glycoside hydrolase catalytic domain [Bacteroidaceae bacterium]
MTRKYLTILVLTLIPGLCPGASKLLNFRVNRMVEATGIMRTAQFSWQIESREQDVTQTAYRICVATSQQALFQETRDRLWDSERVESSETTLVPYQGRKLPTQKDIYWQVTVWLNNGECISGPVQKFITGINYSDWKAEWIGLGKNTDIITEEGGCKDLAARYLRHEFQVSGKVSRAILYLSGMGVSTTYINGKVVSEDVMGTLPSEYTKTVYYNTYDVTSLIRRGRNAIGTVLGNGYMLGLRAEHTSHGLPRLKAQLLIETDRDTLVIPTSEQWKATDNGPIRSNNLYSGELYDARLEHRGWNEPGFDDTSWQQATRMENPKGMLLPQPAPGRRTQEILQAKSIRKTGDGRYIVDMGQNMVGQLRVKLIGKAGQPVIIRHAERLDPGNEDSIYTANLRSARCTNTYIPARDGRFVYHPELVYQGFRYVEISGATETPTLKDIEGMVQYNQMEIHGSFSCDNELLDQLYRNAFWGIRGNYQGMPVDCPQRDERLGWTGDRVTGCYGENLLFDNATLYYKWLKDIEDTQKEDGQISDICPTFLGIYSMNVTWQAVFVYATYMLYSHCGDLQTVMTYYPALRRWTQYVEQNLMHEGVVVHDVYGDWCMPPESKEVINSQDSSRITEATVLSTTVYYDCLRMMAEMGESLGLDADATYYRRKMRSIRDAYNEKLFDTATAQYSNNTVTANILSLELGLVPKGYEERVLQNIIDVTENKFDSHVSCGVLGIQHLMRGLTRRGHADLAMKIVNQRTYPSYGYMIENGATTIWELWNGDTANPAMNSGNHVMLLGDLLLWYYEDLAGIRQKEGTQGYRYLDMSPCFPEELNHVKASYRSVSGLIRSEWTKQGKHLTWTIEIPANTKARISIPNHFNIFPAIGKGIHSVKEEMGQTVIETGSGVYRFQSDI